MVVKDLEKMKWTELKGAQRASALPPNPSTPPLALLCAEETFHLEVVECGHILIICSADE